MARKAAEREERLHQAAEAYEERKSQTEAQQVDRRHQLHDLTAFFKSTGNLLPTPRAAADESDDGDPALAA